MKQTSLFLRINLIRIMFIFWIIASMGMANIQSAQADAAPPPDPTVGGVEPYQPQKTNVQMMAETVLIDVSSSPKNSEDPKQIRVSASFTMRNQGQTEEQMQVIFPLTRLGYGEQSLYEIDISSFAAKVDGRPVTTTEITTPPEGYAEVRWAAFEVTFPVQRDVLLQVKYEMLNPYGKYSEGFTGIAYILETGAGWYGNILSADISLRLPYPITEEAVSANPGYVISGNEMRWTLRDFEPEREDNLEIRAIHADVWQTILNLRAQVEKHPEDADAWAELGEQYMPRAIFMRENIIMGSDPYFLKLALEARQKVVALRRDWGEAHYKLAEILWLGHPGIQNALRQGGESTAPEPSLDDPAIQQALHELQLAWSLGTEGNLLYLSDVFPELVLTVDSITTMTIAPATETPAPTFTPANPVPPTASPTVIPTISPTPTPASTEMDPVIPYGVWIVVPLGLGILIAIFAFRAKEG